MAEGAVVSVNNNVAAKEKRFHPSNAFKNG
jgi:hypothetical protein